MTAESTARWSYQGLHFEAKTELFFSGRRRSVDVVSRGVDVSPHKSSDATVDAPSAKKTEISARIVSFPLAPALERRYTAGCVCAVRASVDVRWQKHRTFRASFWPPPQLARRHYATSALGGSVVTRDGGVGGVGDAGCCIGCELIQVR